MKTNDIYNDFYFKNIISKVELFEPPAAWYTLNINNFECVNTDLDITDPKSAAQIEPLELLEDYTANLKDKFLRRLFNALLTVASELKEVIPSIDRLNELAKQDYFLFEFSDIKDQYQLERSIHPFTYSFWVDCLNDGIRNYYKLKRLSNEYLIPYDGETKTEETAPATLSTPAADETTKKKQYNALQSIMYMGDLNRFDRVIERLYQRGYIDRENHWQKTANELVAFILSLQEKKYFKARAKETVIRKVFETFFTKNIAKKFQPKQKIKLTGMKVLFSDMV